MWEREGERERTRMIHIMHHVYFCWVSNNTLTIFLVGVNYHSKPFMDKVIIYFILKGNLTYWVLNKYVITFFELYLYLHILFLQKLDHSLAIPCCYCASFFPLIRCTMMWGYIYYIFKHFANSPKSKISHLLQHFVNFPITVVRFLLFV